MHFFRKYTLHLLLFLLTFLSTTLAGSEWIYGKFRFYITENFTIIPLYQEWATWDIFFEGLKFSVPFLAFLTVHEFGHYITALRYKVKVTLPYYIPMWLGWSFSIGTMGAFIQIKSALESRKQFFDIGIAGPLAGFVIALGVLVYGFLNLPPAEYIFVIHPEYEEFGLNYAKFVYKDVEANGGAIGLGKNLLFIILENLLVSDKSLIPNQYELMHYPFLFAGYLGLLFTALNLIPIGQLDGGHILYGMVGHKMHAKIAPVFFVIFVVYAGLGMIDPHWSAEDLIYTIPFYLVFLYFIFSRTLKLRRNVFILAMSVFTFQFVLAFFFPLLVGYNGWFAFALLLGRFLGVYHPSALEDKPLDWKRNVLGCVAFVIFILCFSPQPFIVN